MFKSNPKHYRYKHLNCFSDVFIENPVSRVQEWSYCSSHNFVYDAIEQERLLSNGKPCIYTDSRYDTDDYRSNHCGIVRCSRKRPISLKNAIRKINKVRNIPVDTVVTCLMPWYWKGKKIKEYFDYKVKKTNQFNPDYQINAPVYFNNFSDPTEPLQQLVDLLRTNGFLVAVYNTNPSFLIDDEMGGEFAVAYGCDKKVGFSTGNNTFRGYTSGQENILWDYMEEFDKWSRCNRILKTTNYEEVLNILKDEKTN